MSIDDVNALAFDPSTGHLYGVHNRTGGPDLLFRANPANGAVIAEAFGAGVDYVVIEAAGARNEVSGIAIHPATGVMFAAQGDDGGGQNQRLTTIDMATGDTSTVGDTDPPILTGLGFDAGGNLWGTGYDRSAPASQFLYRVSSANASILTSNPIDNGGDYHAVAFALPAPPSTISGTVFEDIAGDLFNDGVIQDVRNPGVEDVDVYLYLDDGDMNLDAGDTLVGGAATQTDLNGDYSFSGLPDGDYHVVVDSKTVTPSQDATAVATDIWAEQTYGPVGGYCDNGFGYTIRATAGACYGGIAGHLSDSFAQWDDREHRSILSLSGAGIVDADFGFSYNVVVSTAGGGTADWDLATNRTVQGSLRQFIQNANAVSGPNTMRFVPAESTNGLDGGGNTWWRISVTSTLPTITGDGTTIDGTAHDFTDGATRRNTNAAQVGSGLPVGTAGTYTSPLLDPELEIRNLRSATVLPTGLVFEASDSVLRHVSIWGFGDAAGTFDTNVRFGTTYSTDPDFTGSLVEFNVIGTGPSAFTDPGATDRSGQNNLTMRETDNAVVRSNLIGFADGSGVTFSSASTSGTVQGNEIRRNGILQPNSNPVGVWYNGNVTGNLITDNASGVFNGPTPSVSYRDNTISANGWGLTRPHGISVSGSNATIQRNVIADNAGGGVVVQRTTSNTSISRNSIYNNGTANAQIGIDLLATGDDELVAPFVTANDSNDVDTGGNGLLNFPVLDTAQLDATDLVVTGWAPPGTTIEFYLADPDPTGFGEGKTWLVTKLEGSADDTDTGTGTYGPGPVNGVAQGTDTTNRFSFTLPLASLAGPVATTDQLTALAISGTNSSEFGGLVTVNGPFVVNSTGDGGDASPGDGACQTATPGQCTLRAAIEEANATPGTDTIHFDIPTSESGYSPAPVGFTIRPATLLPAISTPMIIDASTQPEYATAGRPVIEVDGSDVSAGEENGLYLTGGGATIRGFAINNWGDDGIDIEFNGGNTIVGNYFGTNVTGTAAEPNAWGINFKTTGNVVGGTTPADRNVISGNSYDGLYMYTSSATGNVISGNYIGTTAAGNASLANGRYGMYVHSAANGNTIGGTTGGAGNVISGNDKDGIYLDGINTDDNVILGNRIGTNAAGSAAVPNGDRGIQIESGADDNTIGGTVPEARNVISGNDGDGIVIGDGSSPGNGTTGNAVRGNYIGVAADGSSSLGNGGHGVHLTIVDNNAIGGHLLGSGNVIAYNTWSGVTVQNTGAAGNAILGNSIYSNGGVGIELGIDGATANDPGDNDPGPNDLLNYPVITSARAVSGTTTVDFDLDVPNGSYRVEFFTNTAADGSGNGEGETYVDHVNVVVAAGVPTPASATIAGTAGDILTATATERTTTPFGSTSEFSPAFITTSGAFVVNSTRDGGDSNAGDGICHTGLNNTQLAPECTLHAAIEESNALAGPDTINFDIPTGDTGHSAFPLSYTIRVGDPAPRSCPPSPIC